MRITPAVPRAPLVAIAATLMLCATAAGAGVSLRETVAVTPLRDISSPGGFEINGSVKDFPTHRIWIRVTDELGASSSAEVPVADGRFHARFPEDFEGSTTLRATFYFVDAGLNLDAGPLERAEVTLIAYDSKAGRIPEMPSAFTTDLLGADGSRDKKAPEWERTRAMTNLYYASRSAALAGVGREFDLAWPADLEFYKHGLALYDFDNRDRDWSTPLGRRSAQGFWQAVWDKWFGPSNDNERPPGSGRYPAYTFANDSSDILVAHLMRWRLRDAITEPSEDNLASLCNDVLTNISAMQRKPGDTAPPQPGVEGPGAFYYGMFEDGELMIPGTGWFTDPGRADHRRGGVFLGRAMWAVGEALGNPLPAMKEDSLRATFRLGLRWAFGQAREHSDGDQPYVRSVPSRDRNGEMRFLWRSVGEHSYLLLGMIAACADPDVGNMIVFDKGEFGYREAQTVRTLAVAAIDALADSVGSEGYWSTFADIDANAVAAMARGALAFPEISAAALWKKTVTRVADGWLAARPDPDDYKGGVILPVGRRVPGEPALLRYRAHNSESTHLTYFHAGLWLLALSELERLTDDPKYGRRLDEMLGYFCGNNPFDARLLTETGGVYNFVTDTDGDTIEDRLHFDLYPESTAFVQIGLLRHLELRAGLNINLPPTP